MVACACFSRQSWRVSQLAALPPWHLRAIIIAHDFADPADIDLDALTTTELIELIVGAVSARFAA